MVNLLAELVCDECARSPRNDEDPYKDWRKASDGPVVQRCPPSKALSLSPCGEWARADGEAVRRVDAVGLAPASGGPRLQEQPARPLRMADAMSTDGHVGNLTFVFGHERAVDLDDSVLWSRARSGDSEAFGVLFERHGRTIYNYCFRRVGSWAVAEDLVSIVFLEAWRRVDKQLPSGKELPWLFGIATNVVRNRRRSERRYAAALRRVPSRARSRASRTTATSGSTTRS